MRIQAQRWIGTVSLMLGAAAILAGGAQADRPDDRAGMLGVGAASSGEIEQPSHPNDRGRMLGVGGVFAGSGPDAELAVLRDDAPVRPDDRKTRVTAGTSENGTRGPGIALSAGAFQWGDAAFVAGAAFSLVLVAALAIAAIRHRGRVILP
jgi:hypothetical protein